MIQKAESVFLTYLCFKAFVSVEHKMPSNGSLFENTVDYHRKFKEDLGDVSHPPCDRKCETQGVFLWLPTARNGDCVFLLRHFGSGIQLFDFILCTLRCNF